MKLFNASTARTTVIPNLIVHTHRNMTAVPPLIQLHRVHIPRITPQPVPYEEATIQQATEAAVQFTITRNSNVNTTEVLIQKKKY